jgi:hypothetical protein
MPTGLLEDEDGMGVRRGRAEISTKTSALNSRLYLLAYKETRTPPRAAVQDP